MPDIHNRPFAINQTPCCVWDAEPSEKNADFIESLKPEYFVYLADLYSKDLDGPNRQFASMALGTVYSQAMETFFAVLFAAFQAPHCAVGWVTRYRQDDLNELVGSVGKRTFLALVPLQSNSWEGIIDTIHKGCQFQTQEAESTLKKLIARLWRRFAHDFLDPLRSDQYNTIKHGLRSDPGGATLKMGPSVKNGHTPSEGDYHDFGGSEFGSSFFTLEKIKTYQFRVKMTIRNWDPTILADLTHCLAYSIDNLVVYLRRLNQIGESKDNTYYWPPNDFIENSLRPQKGILNMSLFTNTIEPGDVPDLKKEEILGVYKTTGSQS